MPDPTTELAYAFGPPESEALIRARPEDFQVEELLRFEPGGGGSHAYLRIRKRGMNTRAVSQVLAHHAGVRVVEVGFAGMKDRNAVTTQWFSVNLSGRSDPDWGALKSEALEVLEATRDKKKLRPGQLRQNRFRIAMRSIRGDPVGVKARLDRIASEGVPNYFGAQRFGRDGANLIAAREMFEGKGGAPKRHLKGIYLSAARAHVFNHVLSARVAAGTWNRVLPGEVLMFDDSRSRFATRDEDLSADPRVGRLELHPSGPLWGRGSPDAAGEAVKAEALAAKAFPDLTAGLKAAGLDADRRALRLRVDGLDYREEGGDGITLSFALRPGAFATAVLRELVAAGERSANQPG